MRFLIAATLLLATPALAVDNLLSIPVGTSYGAAREMMLKAGYKPVPHDNSDRCSALPSVCTTYPEVSTCSRSDGTQCRFEWSRAGVVAAAVIETQGETAQSLSVVKAFDASASTAYPLGTSN